MALDVVYCLCGQSSDLSQFMIQCDICKDWFHGRCVGVRVYQAVDIDRFHCPRCEPYHGPSVLKARLNWHRHDYSEPDAGSKPVQTGTQAFIKELKTRHFTDAEKILIRLQSSQFDLPYIRENGFIYPVLVEVKSGLDLVVPPDSFTDLDVENYVGGDYEIDVIDVQRQTDVKMSLHEFIEYFHSPARTTVLNLISLEFSNTSLSQIIEPPAVVRKLCWVTNSWPSDPPPPPPFVRPNVSKYCLISVENSYTDFHIDFGGTSVWYHVLWGEKVFYLIEPTPANLDLYHRWMKASNHSEMFFGDQVDHCYQYVVRSGETLFIPTGWIHAVLTPIDTLVFGGNFLHSFSIERQLQVYELEKLVRTPKKFQFPFYEASCWFASQYLTENIHEVTPTNPNVLSSFINGIKAFLHTLRLWYSEVNGHVSEILPSGLHYLKILKDLQREIRNVERRVIALNPPKPERESKRKKKKIISEDFIDYTNLTSFHNALEERLPEKKDQSGSQQLHFHTLQNMAVEDTSDSTHHTSEDEQKAPLKLTLSRPSYSYNLSHDYGMSGTPPHDPDYQAYKQDYINTVKHELDWNQSADSAAYRLFHPGSLRMRITRTSTDESSSPTPPDCSTPPSTLKLKLGLSLSVAESGEQVYDFKDEQDIDDNDPLALTIDETPQKKHGRGNQWHEPLKMRLSLTNGGVINGEPIDLGHNVKVSPLQSAHNGIDDLLRASAYTPDFTESSMARLEELDTGRASPSTRDAIAGMLSMSRVVHSHLPSRKLGLPLSGRLRGKEKFEDGEYLSKVHQDDDYVYPSLELSDDEDYPVFKPRGRKKVDEAWSPKVSIKILGPKREQPIREGVRRQSQPLKRPYMKRKPRECQPGPSGMHSRGSKAHCCEVIQRKRCHTYNIQQPTASLSFSYWCHWQPSSLTSTVTVSFWCQAP